MLSSTAPDPILGHCAQDRIADRAGVERVGLMELLEAARPHERGKGDPRHLGIGAGRFGCPPSSVSAVLRLSKMTSSTNITNHPATETVVNGFVRWEMTLQH